MTSLVPSRGLTITQRTALWSWVVTFVTLLVFAAVIIPQQKRVFLENLQSKAHGVAVSLRDVAAGSAVNEDFSALVDHCIQMLHGDSALDYIVITKNDGFSIISDRSGWRSEAKVDGFWTPNIREPVSGLGVVSLFNRRVFYYSRPLDYSGIQWGWIHVGLSLDSYDRSVTAVYRRTLLLAAVCILFSLAASVLYARYLVRPILELRNTVGRIAGGDLTARAGIAGRDELSSLAVSVNTMTAALLRRDRILESVRFAAQKFLDATDWNGVLPEVLAQIGAAAEASRAYVFQNRMNEAGELIAVRCYVWTSDRTGHTDGGQALISYSSDPFVRWAELLKRGEFVLVPVSGIPEAEVAWLKEHRIHSLILIPVLVEDQLWGFFGLEDNARAHAWAEAESSLRAAADMFGATVARQRTRDALLEAKQTLEHRVRLRTRELEEQVAAKEKARTDLAEAQARLIDASRAAGKAEVATSVLHNVGNVLNSVGVSATIIGDRLRQSRIAKLQRAVEMLTSHDGSLADFLTADPKGSILPQYLAGASAQLASEQAEMQEELNQLSHNVEHIKKIVSMQQNYARIAGVVEEVCPTDLMEDALRMNDTSFRTHQIEVQRAYAAELPRLCVDRHKVLQILINLLSNARHAIIAGRASDRLIVIAIQPAPLHFVSFRIRDNGVGIAPENLTRIFQLGFTTKSDGHGFGLHSGANAAGELDGRITAYSEGPGRGAEFVLELPLNGGNTLRKNA